MHMRLFTKGSRRRGVGGLALLLSGVLVLTGCGGDDDGSSDSKGDGKKSGTTQEEVDRAAAEDVSEAKITITPKNGSENASINQGVKVTVQGGTLAKVTMTAAEGGTEVPGTLSEDGTSWTPDGQLQRATKYAIAAEAKDGEGRKALANSTFTTVSPHQHNLIPNNRLNIWVVMC